MSSQTLYEAFRPAEEAYREAVLRDTWGHLAPEKGRSYPGRIVFSFGVYDSGDLNPTVLVCDFGELDGGPWFYNAVQLLPGAAGPGGGDPGLGQGGLQVARTLLGPPDLPNG
jgi:hypothetical protein